MAYKTIYGTRDTVSVSTTDDTTDPGYAHEYEIMHGDDGTKISFQNGTVKEKGYNGVTNEALLAVVIHRTEILNSKFPCEENEVAIDFMKSALASFEARTANRVARNVEGTHVV